MQVGEAHAVPQGIAVVFNVAATASKSMVPNEVVALSSDWEVDYAAGAEEYILGVTLENADPGGTVLVLLSGLTHVTYTGLPPDLTGSDNAITSSATPGVAQRDEFGAGMGTALAVDSGTNTLHIYL